MRTKIEEQTPCLVYGITLIDSVYKSDRNTHLKAFKCKTKTKGIKKFITENLTILENKSQNESEHEYKSDDKDE